MSFLDNGREKLNAEIYGVEVRDVAEKVGSLFGEKGKEIGRKIDDCTKNVWIKFPK